MEGWILWDWHLQELHQHKRRWWAPPVSLSSFRELWAWNTLWLSKQKIPVYSPRIRSLDAALTPLNNSFNFLSNLWNYKNINGLPKCVCSRYPSDIPVLSRWSCRITMAEVGIDAINVVYWHRGKALILDFIWTVAGLLFLIYWAAFSEITRWNLWPVLCLRHP